MEDVKILSKPGSQPWVNVSIQRIPRPQEWGCIAVRTARALGMDRLRTGLAPSDLPSNSWATDPAANDVDDRLMCDAFRAIVQPVTAPLSENCKQ